ncbi:N-acetylmuramoyl-L-alanine amidase family protein [Anaeromicropila populeti]|uniref:N-acetylmuramoyl-L-alanine amidase n=1 Tax=Anaeromicropila populeti TaxID=37658 RepID=A0A1I6HN46_9FIRM|nr:N-acetylmuramoyl-L-alanine amidase [Anaeromicropila populeti]SFR55808.1 N-acetylmuramoyl-L-alanine amidase [Anaeromicropila populeti]
MAIKIFVDQGHNPTGFNAGAEGFGLREQDITYNVGTYLANLLSNDYRFEVRTSRTNPEEYLGTSQVTSLQTRVDMANNWPADYFISIHANANENPAINGTEAYVAEAYSEAYYLGYDIVAAIVERVGTRNNAVRLNPSLYVLRKTTMPSVLVELGYLTNYEDSEKLRNDQYQFAYGIYEGLLNYFGLPQL